LQAKIAFSDASSVTFASALRVLPKAAIREVERPSFAASSKNRISFGLEAA
jgi:hypothetical protein